MLILEAQNDTSSDSGMILVIIVIAALVAVMILPRMLRKKRRASLVPEYRPRTDASTIKAAEEVSVQLYEVGREMQAQLDTKMKMLAALLEEADDRIAQLRPLVGEQPAERIGEKPRRSTLDRRPLSPRHARVYALADEGLAALEISRRSGIQVGEVNLILELRSKGEGTTK